MAGGSAGLGLGSVSGAGGTVLGGSVAVPGGVPGSTTLTAILETKDARIQTLEKEVALLEAELQRIKECGGRLREQLLKATAVPSSSGGGSAQQQTITQQQTQQQQQQQQQNKVAVGGIESQMRQGLVTAVGGPQQPGTLTLARGPSVMTSLVPYGHTSTSALTSSLLAGSTGGTTSGGGGGGGSSCLGGISSGATTGVVNPYTDRYADHHLHQLHHHPHHHHHQPPHLHQHQQQQQQQQQLQLQHQQQMQQHLKQIEPAAQGALALHAHTFNKHDMNFKRQVSFFINNVRIEKNDAV